MPRLAPPRQVGPGVTIPAIAAMAIADSHVRSHAGYGEPALGEQPLVLVQDALAAVDAHTLIATSLSAPGGRCHEAPLGTQRRTR